MTDQQNLANAIRALSMDAVQRAGCGHPGMPMGMADIAQVLWTKHLKYNPSNPDWFDRDRFVLSNGHGSMLLYSLLHLTGYDLSIDELKNFRQLGSKTPGHPECDVTPGVETTTGPLGQGIANAVGMAMAEKILAKRFNKKDCPIIDHYTYVFCGDGCLMEGISHEVCSLAGTHKLNKLIVLYDDNKISIDGKVEGWFTDNTPERFKSYGWNVIAEVDGHDFQSIDKALQDAKSSNLPTLICCKTEIGKGSPNKSGSADAHGAALGEEEVKLTRENIQWQHEPFEIPEEIYEAWDHKKQGQESEEKWQEIFSDFEKNYPEDSKELHRLITGSLPSNFESTIENLINNFSEDENSYASRKCSGMCLDAIGPIMPELIGGSADLSPSNNTEWKGTSHLAEDGSGNYLNYGVREFGMSAIMNGMILHGGIRPYAGTFLTFLDYARNAVRMSALMKLPVIYVYTHDSIGVGEDGPTHQPVEHISMLRITPGIYTWRPCDGVETACAWKFALESKSAPSALILSRQSLDAQKRETNDPIFLGGYELASDQNPKITLVASGSEVSLAMKVRDQLNEQNISSRVVSMPCTEIFDEQSPEYQRETLGDLPKIFIEAGQSDFWKKYCEGDDQVVGIDKFGESAPIDDLMNHFGFTVENIIEQINKTI